MVCAAPVGGQRGQTCPGDTFDRLFAGQIDIGQYHVIGFRETLGELRLEIACAAGQVRLEHGDDAPLRVGTPSSGKGRPDRSRVVGVIVDHQNARRRFPQPLETTPGSRECIQAFGDLCEGDT